MDDNKLDEMLGELAKEEDKDFSPEFYATEMARIKARKKELEAKGITDEELDRLLKELAKEEDKDFSPKFYATEMDRIKARKKELEEEEKGPRL